IGKSARHQEMGKLFFPRSKVAPFWGFITKQGCAPKSRPILGLHYQAGMGVLPKPPRIIEAKPLAP
ncbi:MAG: hypothetical protein ACPGWR_30050, partial [Ardenticatenaceae bacterium]